MAGTPQRCLLDCGAMRWVPALARIRAMHLRKPPGTLHGCHSRVQEGVWSQSLQVVVVVGHACHCHELLEPSFCKARGVRHGSSRGKSRCVSSGSPQVVRRQVALWLRRSEVFKGPPKCQSQEEFQDHGVVWGGGSGGGGLTRCVDDMCLSRYNHGHA